MSGEPEARPALVLLMLLLVAVGVEGLSFVAGNLLERRGIFYAARGLEDYPDYLERRDPVLGWPPAGGSDTYEWDAGASRRVPAFPDPALPSCGALYGDSFAWGAEVAAADSPANRLSLHFDCRFGSYGVGGYGTDQAYLRFLVNTRDDAPVVVLTHLSENVLRIVNQYRALIVARGGLYGLKPRFTLREDGGIELVPIPTVSPARYGHFIQDPAPYLRHEFFLPGSAYGKGRLSFPYSIAIARAFFDYRLRARLAGRARYAEFYEPDHPSRGVELAAGILQAFIRSAREQGRVGFVALLPTGKDLLERVTSGLWTTAPLTARLRELGIEPIEVGDEMLAALDGGDPCSLFDDCNKHYNERGYSIMARAIARRIEASGHAPEAQATLAAPE